LNQRENEENSRISHSIDDRLQYESVKIRNKDDIVVQISHQQFVEIASALKSYVATFAC
jgi:uncharacterized FlaG/YvyC family protein